jgi:uncharacterized radical SAM protein YgiQ
MNQQAQTQRGFLPVSIEKENLQNSDTVQFDVIFVTGDPYYDHPLSGIAILSRLLELKGYSVGIVAEPQNKEDYLRCGRAKYLFCITSGLLDSSLANYTPMLRERENVMVPVHAPIVYTSKIKEYFKGSMTVIGGVEATTRRFTHFDYKENKLRRGVLNDSKADLLIHGNAERALLDLLSRIKKLTAEDSFTKFKEIQEKLNLATIDALSYRVKANELPEGVRKLPSFEACAADSSKFSLLTRIHYLLPNSEFIEPCGSGFIKHNRPSHPLSEKEMDLIYDLPFTRKLHPNSKLFDYHQSMVDFLENSVVIGRGCWGSCNFCVIPLVQGKEVAKRSTESILLEIERLYKSGVKKINDLTLPTLNMYGSYCSLYEDEQKMSSAIIEEEITVLNKTKYCNQKCAGCPKRVLRDDLYPLLEGVEKLQEKYAGTTLELRSAIRHDVILNQKKLFRKIMQFTSRLKIAPEHISNKVLAQMNKGTRADFEEFLKEFNLVNKEQGTKKRLVPYFVAGHPGSTISDMEILSKFCDEKNIYVNLTQVFTPTPGTASTAAYYSGKDTFTKEDVYVARGFREKKDQKNILVLKENNDLAEKDDLG